MKLIKYISAIILLLPFLSSCHDYDYENIVASGNPVIKASVPASAMMGDSIDVVVKPCSFKSLISFNMMITLLLILLLL